MLDASHRPTDKDALAFLFHRKRGSSARDRVQIGDHVPDISEWLRNAVADRINMFGDCGEGQCQRYNDEVRGPTTSPLRCLHSRVLSNPSLLSPPGSRGKVEIE